MKMTEVRESRNLLFALETVSAGIFKLHYYRKNQNDLTLNDLLELSDFLSIAASEEQAAFEDFLEMEARDVADDEREWRNFATTGNPDISPEDAYKYENL